MCTPELDNDTDRASAQSGLAESAADGSVSVTACASVCTPEFGNDADCTTAQLIYCKRSALASAQSGLAASAADRGASVTAVLVLARLYSIMMLVNPVAALMAMPLV